MALLRRSRKGASHARNVQRRQHQRGVRVAALRSWASAKVLSVLGRRCGIGIDTQPHDFIMSLSGHSCGIETQPDDFFLDDDVLWKLKSDVTQL